MRILIDAPLTIFSTVEKAQATVARAQAIVASDPDLIDGWRYEVVPDPSESGRAVIRVYDEDSLFVGNL